jgi:hypothetical protein
VSQFTQDGRLKTKEQAALDKASLFDRATGLPKDRTAKALDRASKMNRQTGLPKEPDER